MSLTLGANLWTASCAVICSPQSHPRKWLIREWPASSCSFKAGIVAAGALLLCVGLFRFFKLIGVVRFAVIVRSLTMIFVAMDSFLTGEASSWLAKCTYEDLYLLQKRKGKKLKDSETWEHKQSRKYQVKKKEERGSQGEERCFYALGLGA